MNRPARNSGALFKNDRKREGKKDPDYSGSVVMPDGTEFWLSAWIKKKEGKKTFMSLSFKPKEARHQEPREERQYQAPPPPDDDGEEFP